MITPARVFFVLSFIGFYPIFISDKLYLYHLSPSRAIGSLATLVAAV